MANAVQLVYIEVAYATHEKTTQSLDPQVTLQCGLFSLITAVFFG